MAICSLAQVLAHLGLSDTASNEPAITVQAVTPSGSSTVSQVTLSKTSTVLTVTPTVTAGPSITAATFTLTSESYDTLTELTAGLTALPYLNAVLASPDGTIPSSLISVDSTPISANTLATITYSNATSDGLASTITALIPMVQAMAERYCGRVFDQASLDERYDGNGYETIVLRSSPVSVTSVSIVDNAGNSTTVDSDAYYVDTTRGILYARGVVSDGAFVEYGDRPAIDMAPASRWPVGRRNVRVQYSGGYSTIPSDLQMAGILCVCDLAMDRRNNRLLASESIDGRSLSRRADPDKLIQHYFGPWRRAL